jgi:hypothetical protein
MVKLFAWTSLLSASICLLLASTALSAFPNLGSLVTLTMLNEAGGINKISRSSGKQLSELMFTPIYIDNSE